MWKILEDFVARVKVQQEEKHWKAAIANDKQRMDEIFIGKRRQPRNRKRFEYVSKARLTAKQNVRLVVFPRTFVEIRKRIIYVRPFFRTPMGTINDPRMVSSLFYYYYRF